MANIGICSRIGTSPSLVRRFVYTVFVTSHPQYTQYHTPWKQTIPEIYLRKSCKMPAHLFNGRKVFQIC